jgi:RNA polymerase sigma factor (sigma-70 family)
LAFLKNIDKLTATDLELVRLYKKERDIRVLSELYQRYMDLLFGVCMKYLKNPEEAKDAVMSIFEELISKLMKHDVTNFSGWLYTLAKNHCLMQLRSGKRMKIISDPDLMQLAENPHLNGVFENEEHLNQLTKCIDGLSPEQKMTIQLFYLQNKSYREIASVTQTEWNKVRSQVQNARRNLKICMEKAYPGLISE